MAMVRSHGCARFYGSVVPRRPSVWFYGMASLDPMSSRKCGVQYYGSMDLWYVWSYPMPGYMVCLVLSYVWIYGMCGLFCVAKHYGSGPILCLDLWYVWSMDLWYVRSCRMSSRPMILIYVWLYPTSPRPAILRYARSYPMPPPAGVGLLRISPNHIIDRLKCECVVHTAAYSADTALRSAAWRPDGQRSRQGALLKPSMVF
jgi:hypothetical protein